jgi:LytS/YehU family sensor histidine kinase
MLFPDEKIYLEFLDSSTIIRGVVNFLIIGASAILSLLWYNLEEQKQSTLRKSATEKLSRDAELYKLRQQLQPHFLFNSLNSISALVGNQPEQARKMIQQLSDFLRGALKKEDHEWIAFDDEIQHLRLYLQMEEMRFGHRLTTTIEADEASRTVLVPPMLLQPIVENAIKFGLYDTTENALISIRVNTTNDLLNIHVTNPYDPDTASPRSGTGFGLTSVRRRLYLLFLRNDLLETTAQNKEFMTTIKIPRHDLRSID